MTTTTDETASNHETDNNHLEHEEHEQFLTFTLDDEEYGVDILSVQEIRGWELPTFLPNSPGYIKGVINLRGMIVPIMDLRERFDVGELTYNEQTVVIVVRCCSTVLNRVIGMVVDSVSDVVSLAEHEIHSSPSVSSTVDPDFVLGLANLGKKVVTLLNLEELAKIDEEEGGKAA
tara:strand:+ start:1964 stop:2488 length:525 start_codon:yes stop_codon:yes gene_type:complete